MHHICLSYHNFRENKAELRVGPSGYKSKRVFLCALISAFWVTILLKKIFIPQFLDASKDGKKVRCIVHIHYYSASRIWWNTLKILSFPFSEKKIWNSRSFCSHRFLLADEPNHSQMSAHLLYCDYFHPKVFQLYTCVCIHSFQFWNKFCVHTSRFWNYNFWNRSR